MREIIWMGSSKKDLTKLPVEVKQEMGFALHEAQTGGLHPHAKPFKGAGSGVYEIETNYDKILFGRSMSLILVILCMCFTYFKKNHIQV
jgi:phage-related protein